MALLKELLLQLIVTIAPACAFQLYMYKLRQPNRAVIFLVAVSGAALIVCMIYPMLLNDYKIDFRIVPLTIGILYGGKPAIIALGLLYAGLIYYLDILMWERIGSSVLVVILMLLLYRVHRAFNRSTLVQKGRIVLILISLLMIFGVVTFYSVMMIAKLPITSATNTAVMTSALGTIVAAWLSVYMIEIVLEKQELHKEVLRVSSNYRNEVVKLQQFIDETTSAVLIVDRKGRITHINDIALELLNLRLKHLSVEGILGLSISAVFKSDASIVFRHHIEAALKGEKAMLIPFKMGERSLLHTSFPLRNLFSNKVAGAALIVYDATEITKLKLELTQMDRLSLVGQMAASITHEIRNPMAVVRGFVQLIQERFPEQNNNYFKIILDELDRTNMIINDFLSLAQNRVLTTELCSLNEIVEEIYPLLKADANLRGQIITIYLDPHIPNLLLDRREIKQLLLNIARNGMEAMGEKGLLRIKTAKDPNWIKLIIEDSGEGISADKIPHLFEPFYSTKPQGTGLGLPLCLSIAERHHGKIDVESKKGEGTSFIVSFNCKANLAGVSQNN